MSQVLDKLSERAQAIQHAEQALTICEQIEDPKPRKCARNLPPGASKPTRETDLLTARELKPIRHNHLDNLAPRFCVAGFVELNKLKRSK